MIETTNNKRAAIYVIYDEDGILDTYRKIIINELLNISDKLIVIINGDINKADLSYILSITELVYIRDNVGYEMKAYEDLFLKYISPEFWKEFDELIMCNDSFYGPFISMEDIFSEMKTSSADYWGINMVCNGYVKYLSSYFVVYKSNIINNNELINYFNACKEYDISDFMQVVQLFEVGLFYYLRSRGYTSDSYIKGIANNITKYPDYYLIKKNVPFMKRKSFCKDYYDVKATRNALQYLKKKYDVSYIVDNAYRKYGYENKYNEDGGIGNQEQEIVLMDSIKNKENEIVDFCIRNKDIYIYGAGRCARKVWAAYRHYMHQFRGFIISDNQTINDRVLWGFPVFYYSELTEHIAFILAIKNQNAVKIKEGDVFI